MTRPEPGPQGLDRRELTSERVKAVLRSIDRRNFIPDKLASSANDDRALPIGWRQTISQPFIVGIMSQEADISPGDRVLEIGTGSGYQSAVLAELGATVYTIEIIPELSASATETLKRLGYSDRVHTKVGDGWEGWRKHAPYNAILVTAASPSIPKMLLDQLCEGGRLIIPLEIGDHENLLCIEKRSSLTNVTDLGEVKFVPLTGIGRD
jgi:protein-L-isoaspartate(D-aspartate) O-methyltransferase